VARVRNAGVQVLIFADGSGWVWSISLHDGTLSCGLVVYQETFFAKKKASDLDGLAFYKEYLKQAAEVNAMLRDAKIVSDLKQASDWSYSASAYAGPNFRIVGDAGCFVDPYFSPGVHLALTSGLFSAVTIQAARRGTDEQTAAKWHAIKTAEGYTRFLLLVMTVLGQLRMKEYNFLSDDKEQGFDKAFEIIQPVIQGAADTAVNGDVQKRAAQSINFALGTLEPGRSRKLWSETNEEALIAKIQAAEGKPEMLDQLSQEEVRILTRIKNRTVLHTKEDMDLTNFAGEVIDGFCARLVRGDLGLIEHKPKVADAQS
jgi:flavine halogenase